MTSHAQLTDRLIRLRRPVRAIHSALCTRVLLNLRKVAAKSSSLPLSEFTQVTQIAFEHDFARNLDTEHHAVEIELELEERGAHA